MKPVQIETLRMTQNASRPTLWGLTHRVALALSLVMLTGAGLRLYKAASFSFWFDEILTAIDVQYYYKNFFIDRNAVAEFPLWSWDHPPLYFMLSKQAIDWLGVGEIPFRLTAIVAGVLTILALYLLGKELFDVRVGLAAALLLTVSVFHVRYSQEARPYALALLANVVAYWCLARALRRNTPWYWLGWAVANLVGIYSHYLALVALACQLAIADLVRHQRKQLFYLILASALMVVAFLPWRENFMDFLEYSPEQGVETRAEVARILYRFSVTEFGLRHDWLLYMGLLLIAVSLLLETDRVKRGLILLGGGVSLALMAIFFIDPSTRLLGARYLLPVLPIWLLLLANGVVKVGVWGWAEARGSATGVMLPPARRRMGVAAVAVPLVFTLLYSGATLQRLATYYQTPREPFKDSAAYIQARMLPGEPVLINREHYGYAGVLDYYPRRFGFEDNIFAGKFTVEQVAGMCVDKQRAWYWSRVDRRVWSHPVVEWLQANGDCSHSEQFNGFLLCSCGEPAEAIAAAASAGATESTLVKANALRTMGQWQEATTLYLDTLYADPEAVAAVQGLRILGQITGNRRLEIDALAQQLAQNPTDESLGRALKQAFTSYFTGNPEIVASFVGSASSVLPDGSFEEGNAFRVPGGADAQPNARFGRDSTMGRTGATSLMAEGVAPGRHGGWAHQIRILGNVPFLFAGYVKTENVDGLTGRLMYWENNGSTHLGWVNMTEPLGEWTLVWSVVLLPQQHTLVNLRPALFEGVGTIWMDDIVLINLIENLDQVQVTEEE